tara:strand:- start:1440 stop:1553 length:114 start_codon:yes stop_codon:yes gene_type:complete
MSGFVQDWSTAPQSAYDLPVAVLQLPKLARITIEDSQ